tara:strand:- start:168 stop:605 length:438 start_codon:yes stop_codon:yes gene_type:complete
VPLDQSPLAMRLAEYSIKFASEIGATMTFITVCQDFEGTAEGALQRTLSPDRFIDIALHEAKQTLQAALDLAALHGVRAVTQLRIGDAPFEEIINEVRSSACDLVVMASHGHHGLERLLVGSQTQKVLDSASVPVLVMPLRSNGE